MKKILKVEEWASLREYYNVLLSYLQSSWLLMWGENSYSEMITSQLDDNEDDTEIRNFEAYIVKNDYFEKIEELVEIAKGVNDYFEYIKNQIQIDTEGYGLVKPKIFDRDVYLKESNKILSEFLAIKNKLKKYKENLK